MPGYIRRIVVVALITGIACICGCSNKPTESIIETVATPRFDPPGGSYAYLQTVHIACQTPGVTIRYTTDGTKPSSDSPLYQSPIVINKDTVLKARAFHEGWISSKTASANYTITDPSIEDIHRLFAGLAMDFNYRNINGILSIMHNEYMHNGFVLWHLNQVILDRMELYDVLEIEVLNINIDGEYAVVTTRDRYCSETEDVTFNEPGDGGYFCYLYRVDGACKIYGNQSWQSK